ncbi:MAG: DUF294 nucleotidyltransferase-like domain-containing protein, partial [Thiothrix sp.]
MIATNPLLDIYVHLTERGELQISTYSQALREARQLLNAEFHAGQDIHNLLRYHSDFIDALLCHLWAIHGVNTPEKAALVAVGGYGRQELHPASDIDLLILLVAEPQEECRERLAAFITLLWDIGLEVGHSVRTLTECIEEARKDLTVITNLIEARFLAGNQQLFTALNAATDNTQMWDSPDFFLGKLAEQHQRYQKFGDASHRVEPNLKEGRGGLRDIQTIGWVTQRKYGTFSLQELYEKRLLEYDEYETLREGRRFLWRIRFA